MKLDEIGKTIKEEELTGVLDNFRFSIKQTMLVVDENGNAVNDLVTIIDDTQYVHVKGNRIELVQPNFYRRERAKQEFSLAMTFLRKQLAAHHFKVWPIAANEKLGNTIAVQIPEQLFLELYQRKFKQYKLDYYDFRNQVYLKIAQGFEFVQPLLTYLTGTSLLFTTNNQNERPHRSQLTMEILKGIQDYQPDLRSLKGYLGTRNALGKVQLQGQFDQNQGITALTLKAIDLNPFNSMGIDFNILELVNCLTGYFLMSAGVNNDELAEKIQIARETDLKIATASPFKKLNDDQKYRSLISELNQFADEYNNEVWGTTSKVIIQKLDDVMETPAARLLREQGSHSLFELLLEKVRNQKIANNFLKISDNSVRILQAAFNQGADYQIIDSEQEIVEVNGHYIFDGIQSDLDQAVVAKLWDNKEVAKQLLGDLPVQIQPSWKISSVEQATNLYKVIKGKAIVIKNADGHTNQKGILYRLAASKKEFLESVGELLKQTSTILVEQVSSGSTYQAMILNGRVVSLIERVPENVVGDGRSNLKQLIERKNLKIERNEKKTLMMQGLTFDQPVPRGIQVLLRYDSFTGSGFQSVDALDDADSSYLELLEEIAHRLKMKNGFIDMIFDNIYQPYSENHPELAVFLSAHATAELKPHEEMALNQRHDIAGKIVEQFK